jgi:hypothetical protein
VAAVRAAHVRQPRLGEITVRDDYQIVIAVEEVRRAPVRIHDAAFDAIAQHNPVPDGIGSAEIQSDARKDVAEGALHCEAEDVAIAVPATGASRVMGCDPSFQRCCPHCARGAFANFQRRLGAMMIVSSRSWAR